ncbi:fibronectin type III domain-containing protein [Mucilaginibacter ginsenosidivorax]|uniref:Fibronectin type III domain-containing protein n=1 Tax=Mucilaginibacter ginsenosidivorax TaxID=862126 RepID=A0A5B8W8P2_9SPHI|nr:hypothetical protein [Mucilaginibacter ginsenosidivorax]QEC79325.1 hypothetical protein FSB76_26495 [Mucilaginibacter ginsenosidivorax]
MKLKHLFYILPVYLALNTLLSSCKEFIEPSIAKRQVILQAPADQYLSTKYTVNFWWDEVEDALSYRLQVVTPGFDSVGSLILDTLVKGNKFTSTLEPGNYQWRVRAENGSSQTAYSPARRFVVEESSLTNQTVTLSSPANNVVTNTNAALFKWNSLFGATKYQVQIDTNNFANDNVLVYNQVVPGLQVNFTFPKDQVYGWRVRAENETEQSKWSAINYVTYQLPLPPQVSLVSPANGSSVSLPVQLSWNSVTGVSGYKLYVFKSDSTTLYSNNFPMTVNSTGYSFTLGVTGEKIYWKVSALNASGKEGKASALRNFVLF